MKKQPKKVIQQDTLVDLHQMNVRELKTRAVNSLKEARSCLDEVEHRLNELVDG